MRYLLSAVSRPVLQRLALERTLCAFDFDGTLAPIVEHPDKAAMRERTRALLVRLVALYPCIVVSGRARVDLLGRLDGVNVEHVIGSHGGETEETTGNSRHAIRKWTDAIELELGSEPGLWVENKGTSLAVHYRQFPRKAEARRRIRQATRNLENARIFGGKQVVNLVEADAPTKGAALAAERDRLKCDWVLYVGDDENDEDAFAITGNIVPVRVGRRKGTHARYYLRTQIEIDKLLELIVMLRERPKAAIR